MDRDLPEVMVALIIWATCLIALAEIRNRELARRAEESFRAWVMRDLPPVPEDVD